MSENTWYEVHLSIDGHVTGYEDRKFAEIRADELQEEHGQNARVVEVNDE